MRPRAVPDGLGWVLSRKEACRTEFLLNSTQIHPNDQCKLIQGQETQVRKYLCQFLVFIVNNIIKTTVVSLLLPFRRVKTVVQNNASAGGVDH